MFISIDVGGTNTRLTSSRQLTNLLMPLSAVRRRNAHDFEDDVEFIIRSARQLAGSEAIEAIGIGTPGVPNADKTRITEANNLASWVDRPLVQTLASALDCPVYLDGDVVAAGLGEVYYGHMLPDFDYIIWGTGIGGGIVRQVGGRPEVSALDWQSSFSSWEQDCGGARLELAYAMSPQDFSPEDWQQVARAVAVHLENYVKDRQPKAIVFGGGLAVKQRGLLVGIGRSLGVRIEVAKFGEDAGLAGGFGLIKHALMHGGRRD